MGWQAGDLVRITMTWRDTRWPGNVFRNIVNFRGYTGEIPDEDAWNILEQVETTWVTRMLANLCTTTYLSHIRVVNVNRTNVPIEEVTLGQGAVNGDLITSLNDVPQASACFVRRSYSRGRRSLGRYFHGPLPTQYTSGGLVNPDPLGFGDLQDVCDALGDPITAGDLVLRPVVVAAKQPTVNASHDVRKVAIAAKTVYLKSRRLGMGE